MSIRTRYGVALLLCAAFLVAAPPAGAAVPLRVFQKSSYPLTDVVVTGVEPNVFFLLDVGSPMTFSPKGQMPIAEKRPNGTYPPRAGNDDYYRPLGLLMQEATYGVGGRPLITGASRTRSVAAADNAAQDIKKGDVLAQDVVTGTEMSTNGYSRYGRETDYTNNIIGTPQGIPHPDHYYSPYDNKPYYLTFKNSTYANWVGPMGTVNGHNYGFPAGFPENLKPYMAGGSERDADGTYKSVPQALADTYLVPNDSRMYMMRLVLWRLTNPDHADMFTGINVAMGTSYQESHYGSLYYADFYKVDDYDARPPVFPYGSGPDWATGIYGQPTDYNTYKNNLPVGYQHSQGVYSGIDRDYYDPALSTPALWRQVNRAIMKTPFDKFYRLKNDGSVVATEKLLDFRQYIDGIEAFTALNAGQDPQDPEFIADGQTPLSTSIHGREYHVGQLDSSSQELIYYAPKTLSYGVKSVNLISSTTLNGFKTGQAIGSVPDFFSPRVAGEQANGLAFSDNTLGFFPVTGSCQSNWLVVFTAGNDEAPGAHSAAEAALKLYKDTTEMRGRAYNSVTGKWDEKIYNMDTGVRTLVVGFVDPSAGDEQSKRLRNTLNDIAQNGDPIRSGSTYVKNPEAAPYFANDVPGLLNSLNMVLKRVNSDRLAVGAPVGVRDDSSADTDYMFSSSYTVHTMDQWSAWLYKHKVTEGTRVNSVTGEEEDDSKTEQQWEASDKIAKQGSRRLYAQNGANVTSALSGLAAYGNGLWGLSSSQPFLKWLEDYDKDSGSKAGVLGDSAHSGIMVVGAPKAQALKSNAAVNTRGKAVYIQTNRGFLHSIDFESGTENWGFVPPNIFEGRLKFLKYDENNAWYSGNGETAPRSNPLVLLDGLLAARDVGFSGDTYHTVLLASMGWGGNGLYAMDITDPGSTGTAPKFLWAVENARYTDEEPALIDGVRRWGTALPLDKSKYDYGDLGLTIQAALPVLSQSGEEVAILPGGLGYKLGWNGDTQGRAFYFIAPETGEILKKIDTQSAAADFTSGRPLGMAVTPVSQVDEKNASESDEIKQYKIKSFYTADSNGNILRGDAGGPVSDWTMKGIFELVTQAESANSTLHSPAVAAGLPLVLPHALLVAKEKNNGPSWLFGGTADLMVPDATADRSLQNEQQYIFGVRVNGVEDDPGSKLADLSQWPYYADAITPAYGEAFGATPRAVNGKGWALRLRPRMDDPANPRDSEYVTTAPFLYEGYLFIATFVPRIRAAGLGQTCPEVGDSKLYALNPLNGKSLFKTKDHVLLQNIKITGISAKGRRVYLGIQQQLNPNSWNEANDVDLLGKTLLAGGAVASFALPINTSPKNDIAPDIPNLHYWRERLR